MCFPHMTLIHLHCNPARWAPSLSTWWRHWDTERTSDSSKFPTAGTSEAPKMFTFQALTSAQGSNGTETPGRFQFADSAGLGWSPRNSQVIQSILLWEHRLWCLAFAFRKILSPHFVLHPQLTPLHRHCHTCSLPSGMSNSSILSSGPRPEMIFF
jgi:hypothetical protein